MIPWGLLGQGLKSGLEIYKNKKAADVAMSEAKLLHIEKMKRGEIEFSGKIAENQKNDWKDEFVLLTISSPLFLLGWSVFAEDEKMQEKIDLYFQKLQEMPWWIVGLWVSVVAAIYGQIQKTPNKNFKQDKSYTLDIPSKRNPNQKTFQRIEGGKEQKKKAIQQQQDIYNKQKEDYRSPFKKGGKCEDILVMDQKLLDQKI
jgi:hypothetical protein